jgi:hypothetical protein
VKLILLCVLPHNYKPLPPLWYLQEKLELTDEHPSGLRWTHKNRFVTRQDKQSGFYLVSIDNDVYLAHRIVYCLRTGQCPDKHSVKHGYTNRELDNRLDLEVCYRPVRKQRKPSWSWD